MSNKGSRRGSIHPYLRTELWMDRLAFWRNHNPGSIMGYNVEAYETILAGWVERERNKSIFESNLNPNSK